MYNIYRPLPDLSSDKNTIYWFFTIYATIDTYSFFLILVKDEHREKKDKQNEYFIHCIVNPHLTNLSMSSFHGRIHLMKRALPDIVVHSTFAELIFFS